MAVLYGDDAFSILVLSAKIIHSSFLKKVFVFHKIYLIVKILKTFKIFTDCFIKNVPASKIERYLENP